MPETFTFDEAKAPRAEFSFDTARHLPADILQQIREQDDPFAPSQLPANASKPAVIQDFHRRAANLQHWHDLATEGAGFDAPRREEVEGQYRAQRDRINDDARARGIPFTIFKPDEEILADKVKAATWTPADVAALKPGKQTMAALSALDPAGAITLQQLFEHPKIGSAIESGGVDFAGGLSSPENAVYMIAGGEPRLAQVLTKPFMAMMVTQGTAQTTKGVAELAKGKPEGGADTVQGILTTIMGAAGTRATTKTREAPSDTTRQTRIQSSQPEGQEPGQRVSQPESGPAPAAPGGILQTPAPPDALEPAASPQSAVVSPPSAAPATPEGPALDDVHRRMWEGEEPAVRGEVLAAGEEVTDANVAQLLREAKQRMTRRDWEAKRSLEQARPKAPSVAPAGAMEGRPPPSSSQPGVVIAPPAQTSGENQPPEPLFNAESANSALARLKAKAAQAAAPVMMPQLWQAPEVSSEEQARLKAERAGLAVAQQERERQLAAAAQSARQAAPARWTPPAAETVAPVPAAPAEGYTFGDAVHDAGGLSAPDLDESLAAMRKGQPAAKVIADWSGGTGEHDELAGILEEIAGARDSKETARYRYLREAYKKAFAFNEPGGADKTLAGLRDIQEQGMAPGRMPESEGELYRRAWEHASTRADIDEEATAAEQAAADFDVFNQSLKVESRNQKAEIYSGEQKLGEVRTDAQGRKIFAPTAEGETLPPEYQMAVLGKAGIETEHGMDVASIASRPPEFDPTILEDLTAVAGRIVEGGNYDFPSYARAMSAALDGQYPQYYHAAYNQVREFTEAGALRARMTPRQEIESYDATGQSTTGSGPGAAGGGPQLSGAVGGSGRGRRPGLRVVDEGDLPTPRAIVRSGEYTGPKGASLDESQRFAVNLALGAFAAGKPAFLLGDGTGVGKTGTELAIAAQSYLQTKLPSLIITQGQTIIENRFKADLIKLGIPSHGLHFATYTDLSLGKVPQGEFGVAIYDEAHNLKNLGSSRQFHSELVNARHKVFATATPMDSPTHASYFLAQLTGKSRAQIAKELGYHFEQRLVQGELRNFAVLDKDMNWGMVVDNIRALRNHAVKEGQFIRREYPFYGRAAMREAPRYTADQLKDQTAIIKYWDDQIRAARGPQVRRNLSGQKTLELSRWAEIQKLPAMVEQVNEDLSQGKYVVVFAEGYKPTYIKGLGKTVPGFLAEMAGELDRRGIKYAKVFEDSAGEKAAAAEAFQKQRVKMLLATPRSGGAGLDMDDQIGNAPRSAHAATLNFAADVFDQMLGRVSRRNTATPAEFQVWRNRESYSDGRRAAVADRKMRVLRNIQAGKDLDTSEFERNAQEQEHGMDVAGAFSFDPMESAQQQQAREGRQDQRDRLRAEAARRLAGDTGDLGQTDMFAPPADLWAARKGGEVEHGMEALPAGSGPMEGPPNALVRELQSFRDVTAPQTANGSARFAANLLRELNAKRANQMFAADLALRKFRNSFDRTQVRPGWRYDPALPLPRNYAFIDAYETGNTAVLSKLEQPLAAELHRQNADWLDRLHALEPGMLQHAIENYFGHLWQDPVRAKAVLGRLLAARPLEGPKGFLKQRTYALFREGLAAGLKPVHDNPIDLWLLKKREVERFIMGRAFVREMRDNKQARFVYVFSKAPQGWAKVNDPAFTQYAPPWVPIKEAFDAGIRAKTLEVLEKLGVPHQRLVKIGGRGAAIGRWGMEAHKPGQPGTERIVSKFGGPEFVIWHELGHALDSRYEDLRKMLSGPAASPMQRELGELAQLRYAGLQNVSESFKRNVQTVSEKMAVVLQAYLHAPDLMAKRAPTVRKAFESFLAAHPELQIINDIRPTLTLGEATAKMPLSGLIKLGDWYVPENAARVINNYLSPGLNTHLWYRTLRESSNLLNAAQLGMSAFHLGFTSLDAVASRMAVAIEDLAAGRLRSAAATAASLPAAPFTNIAQGARLRAAVLHPERASEEMQKLVAALEAAGGRVGQDRFWQTHFTRRMVRAFHEGTATGLARGTLNAPFALVEQMMRPIMEYVVPRQKLGVFADLARREFLRLGPDAKPEAVREAMRKAWDSVDNRMGQMVYDNLFYDRAAKDVTLLAFRAYGWQLGKYREGFGGVADAIRAAGKVATGERPELSHRMAYVMALPIVVGVLGGAVNYLMTGQRPQGRDWWQPRTGDRDRFGNEVRLNFPSYIKDVIAYSKHPAVSFGHSLNPLLSTIFDLFQNRDFYNVTIRNTDDPLWQQGSEVSQFLARQAMPFSVSGTLNLREDDAPAWKQVAPFFGITPVPARITMTPAQEFFSEAMADQMPAGPLSREKAARSRMAADLAKDLRKGQLNEAGELEAKLQPNKREATAIMQRVLWTPLQYQVQKVSVKTAIKGFRLANDREKLQIAKALGEKIARAHGAGTLDEELTRQYLAEVYPWYQKAVALENRPAPAPAGNSLQSAAFAR